MISSTIAGIVPFRHLATSCPCVVWHHAVGRPDCSGAFRVANGSALHCCGPAVTCQHVLLAFNVPSSSRSTGHHDAVYPTSGRYLGNARVRLGNVRAYLYLLLMAHRRSRYACFLRAPRHVVAPELTCWARSCGTHGSSGAPRSQEVGVQSYRACNST
jgi:hypothetical protein